MKRRPRRTFVVALLLTLFGIAAGTSQGALAPATTIGASSTATFGRTTIGTLNPLTADRKRVSRFTLKEAGSVSHISAYVDGYGGGSGSQVIRFVIYGDSSGNPAGLLGTTGPHTIAKGAAARWVMLALPSPLTLKAGTYHLGIHSGTTNWVGRYALAPLTHGMKQNDNRFTSGATSPFGNASPIHLVMSIYATYTPQSAPVPAPPPIPTVSALPTISGSAVEGNVLTASEGTWNNAPTSYAYSWERCNDAGTACTPIAGATASTRTLGSADVGSRLRVVVTATNAGGSASAASAATAVVAPAPDTQAPSSPQELTASGVTETEITLGWSAATDNVGVTGYHLYRDGTHIGSTPSLSYAFGSLSCGTGYTLAVEAHDAAGNLSGRTGINSATSACPPPPPPPPAPDTQPPSVPQGMGYSGKTQTSVSLIWNASTDNVGVAGYHLYRDGVRVGSTQSLSYTFSGLACATAYTFGLEAYDAAGNVSNRGEASGTTSTTPCDPPPADTQPPSSPQGLTASGVTETEITLGWSAATDNVGVTGYHVYRDGTRVASTPSLSQAFSSLTCGTSYTLGVEAYDAAGNSSSRASVNSTTSACPPPPPPPPAPDTQPPSVPQGMAFAGKTQTSVSLIWNASTDNVGVAGYHLYRNGVRVGSTQSLSYTFSGLTCATAYTFGLEAYDAAGNVSNRGEASGTTSTSPCDAPPADTQPPSAPQGLSLPGKTQTSVSLAWNASTDNVGVTGYHVYRDGTRIASTPSLSYTFGGLSCGTSYTFAVEAYDAAGNVSNPTAATLAGSTDACDAPPPPPPPPPPPGTGTANLWVDLSGGTCTRSATPTTYVDAAACSTFDAAYDSANASTSASTVLVKGGTYPGQSLSGNRSATSTITFERAPAETVLVKGVLSVAGADRITFKNLETAAFGSPWENPNNKFAVRTTVGTTFIRFENMTVGGFLLEGSQDIDIIGGSVGPCRAQSFLDAFGSDGTTGPLGNGIQPCYGGLKIDHNGAAPNRILVDGVDFHDFDYSDECVRQGKPGYVFPPGISPDTCHWRVMYNNGVQNFTLRNSTFRNSVFQPWFTISGPDASTTGNQNILIENNQFGAQLFYQVPSYGVGGALTLAHCRIANGYRNVTIRFNSFSNMGSIDLGLTEAGCGFQNINIYGNIVSKGVYSCVAGVNYAYNVYTRSSGTCGGTGETHIGGSTFPFFTSDTAAPFGWAYALAGAVAAPDNRVPTSMGCPAADARGVARPQTPGFCDAGAFER